MANKTLKDAFLGVGSTFYHAPNYPAPRCPAPTQAPVPDTIPAVDEGLIDDDVKISKNIATGLITEIDERIENPAIEAAFKLELMKALKRNYSVQAITDTVIVPAESVITPIDHELEEMPMTMQEMPLPMMGPNGERDMPSMSDMIEEMPMLLTGDFKITADNYQEMAQKLAAEIMSQAESPEEGATLSHRMVDTISEQLGLSDRKKYVPEREDEPTPTIYTLEDPDPGIRIPVEVTEVIPKHIEHPVPNPEPVYYDLSGDPRSLRAQQVDAELGISDDDVAGVDHSGLDVEV